jgi:hypothetical protein
MHLRVLFSSYVSHVFYIYRVHSRLIGFQTKRFGFFMLITMLCNFTSVVLGMAVSAVAPDGEAASALGVPILILCVLFGGFYVSINALPIVANWIPYISIFRWAYQALCINEFKGLNFSCDAEDTQQCILTGEEVLSTMNFSGHSTSYACFGLGMVLIGFLCVAYVMLELSTLHFMSMGYTGRDFLKHSPSLSNEIDENGVETKALESLPSKNVQLVDIKNDNSTV